MNPSRSDYFNPHDAKPELDYPALLSQSEKPMDGHSDGYMPTVHGHPLTHLYEPSTHPRVDYGVYEHYGAPLHAL